MRSVLSKPFPFFREAPGPEEKHADRHVIYPRVTARPSISIITSAPICPGRVALGRGGLTGAEALRGTAAADGSEASFVAIALLRFASMDAFRAAMGGPHAPRSSATSPISPTSSRSSRSTSRSARKLEQFSSQRNR
jgi:hypothetical protein